MIVPSNLNSSLQRVRYRCPRISSLSTVVFLLAALFGPASSEAQVTVQVTPNGDFSLFGGQHITLHAVGQGYADNGATVTSSQLTQQEIVDNPVSVIGAVDGLTKGYYRVRYAFSYVRPAQGPNPAITFTGNASRTIFVLEQSRPEIFLWEEDTSGPSSVFTPIAIATDTAPLNVNVDFGSDWLTQQPGAFVVDFTEGILGDPSDPFALFSGIELTYRLEAFTVDNPDTITNSLNDFLVEYQYASADPKFVQGTVIDNVPPMITLNTPSSPRPKIINGQNCVFVDFGARAIDEVGNLTPSITWQLLSGTTTVASGTSVDDIKTEVESYFNATPSRAAGSYSVVYTVVDPSGNTGMAILPLDFVHVTTGPTILLNDADLIIDVGSGFTDPGIASAFDSAGAFDYSGSVVRTITNDRGIEVDVVGTFGPDTFTIVYTVEDCTGRTATAQRMVEVVGRERVVHYQGILPDTITVTAGPPKTADMEFRIYADAGLTNLEWGQDWSSVEIDADGAFAVQLGLDVPGTTTPVASPPARRQELSAVFMQSINENHWMVITVTDSSGSKHTLSSVQILDAPYAIFAAHANHVDVAERLDQDEEDRENIPVGTIVSYGGPLATLPEGWLLCDGRRLNAVVVDGRPNERYLNLFNKLTYLAPTSTVREFPWGRPFPLRDDQDFLLPDLRGMFLRGVTIPSRSNFIITNAGSIMEVGLSGVMSEQEVSGRIPNPQNSISSNPQNTVGSFQRHAFRDHDHRTSNGDGLFRWLVKSDFEWTADPEYLDDSDPGFANEPNLRTTRPMTKGQAVGSPRDGVSAIGSTESRPVNAYVNYIIKY